MPDRPILALMIAGAIAFSAPAHAQSQLSRAQNIKEVGEMLAITEKAVLICPRVKINRQRWLEFIEWAHLDLDNPTDKAPVDAAKARYTVTMEKELADAGSQRWCAHWLWLYGMRQNYPPWGHVLIEDRSER